MFGDNSWHTFCLQVVTFTNEMTSLCGVLRPGSCRLGLRTPTRMPAPKPPGPCGHSEGLPHGSSWSSPKAGSAPCFPHSMGPCTCWMLYHCCVLPCILMIFFPTGSTGELLKDESSSAHLEGSAGPQRTRPKRQPCPPIMRVTSSTAFTHSSTDSLTLGCPGEYKMMTDVQSFFFHRSMIDLQYYISLTCTA